MMPVMGGAEVHDWIRDRRADLLPRFVFLTGGATDAKSAELLASMENASVEKPFSPTTLRTLVTSFVTRVRT
jgi:two-component system, NtrC family, sensor kinase